jgi:hypothetical protein
MLEAFPAQTFCKILQIDIEWCSRRSCSHHGFESVLSSLDAMGCTLAQRSLNHRTVVQWIWMDLTIFVNFEAFFVHQHPGETCRILQQLRIDPHWSPCSGIWDGWSLETFGELPVTTNHPHSFHGCPSATSGIELIFLVRGSLWEIRLENPAHLQRHLARSENVIKWWGSKISD